MAGTFPQEASIVARLILLPGDEGPIHFRADGATIYLMRRLRVSVATIARN